MDGPALRRKILEAMLDKLEDTRFPSTMTLDGIQSSLSTEDELAAYAGILVDKLEDTRFPSTELYRRVDGIVARLPAESRG